MELANIILGDITQAQKINPACSFSYLDPSFEYLVLCVKLQVYIKTQSQKGPMREDEEAGQWRQATVEHMVDIKVGEGWGIEGRDGAGE